MLQYMRCHTCVCTVRSTDDLGEDPKLAPWNNPTCQRITQNSHRSVKPNVVMYMTCQQSTAPWCHCHCKPTATQTSIVLSGSQVQRISRKNHCKPTGTNPLLGTWYKQQIALFFWDVLSVGRQHRHMSCVVHTERYDT